MSTVGTIIEAAARKLQVDGMTAAELADGIEALNMMLMEWQSIQSLKTAVTRETFNITSGTASYTVGSGGTIDTTWPSRIKAAFIRDDDDVDHGLAIFSSEEYAYTGQKSDSERPVALYHERTYPLGTFFFWPTPDATYTVHLWSHKIFTQYTATDDSLALAPEYEPAVIYNLALELAPEFGKEPSPIIYARASHTLRSIRNMNAHPIPQIDTDVVCKKSGSASYLFEGWDANLVGTATLPFVLRG